MGTRGSGNAQDRGVGVVGEAVEVGDLGLADTIVVERDIAAIAQPPTELFPETQKPHRKRK